MWFGRGRGLTRRFTYLSSSHQEEYRLPHWLNCLPVDEEFIVFPEMSELQVQTTHSKVEPSESGPNWLHKEYPILLAFPVGKIVNAFFKEMKLPLIWKVANVFPLPKFKSVENLTKDLRPISLTACLSKVAEEFVVQDYVKLVI